MTGNSPVLILFDLVSTITDAGPRYAAAYARMAEQYGVHVPDHENIMADLGNKNLKEIIARHSPDLPVDKVQSFMGDCNNACDALLYDVHWVEQLYPNVRETLQTLKGQGHTLGLYTGTREDAMQAQLRYHNLLQYFDSALLRGKDNNRDGAMNTQALKIAQMKSLVAEFQLRHDGKGRVMIVGDSVSDFQAAREIGTVFVGFAENWKKSLDMKEAGVGASFSKYTDLPDIVAVLTAQPLPPKALRANFNIDGIA
jgi:phosphoglycolate phosphatase-like HAD superfamily hydrolase